MESTKIEILEKVLQKIEDQLTRGIQIKSESSDKFDKALSYCIDEFNLFSFEYQKGHSGHVDFEKVFHNAEIHKLYTYLFTNKKYKILDKYIKDANDMITFFGTFYPNIYIEWESYELDLQKKEYYLDFTEYKLSKGIKDFEKIGEFLCKFTDDTLLKDKYPKVFELSGNIPKKHNYKLIEDLNHKSKTESLELIKKYIEEGMEYANAGGGELYASGYFIDIKNNKYAKYILDEHNMIFNNGNNNGSLVKIETWKHELSINLNKWIHDKKIGDLHDSINSKIVYEISNIIFDDFKCYELKYNHSGKYIWCDGFQYIWTKEEEKYTLRFSLDD